jgi:uncharacterized protein (DUF488 family)
LNPRRGRGFWASESQQRSTASETIIDPPTKLFTVGHSTRTIPEFVDLLRTARIDLLADVRHIPRSLRNPDYNLDRLPSLLADYQIGHVHLPELGGRRPRARDVPPEANGFWDNQSFHNYADYALSAEFASGLDRLLALASERRCAIMCSEAVWWRCHRRIIADYALVRGWPVFHLMGADRIVPASLTLAAQPHEGRIFYPPVGEMDCAFARG